MPDSKGRLPHRYSPHQKTSNTHARTKKTNRAVIAMALFCGFLGLGISTLIYGANITGVLAGAIIGGLIGGIFGYLIAKNLSDK